MLAYTVKNQTELNNQYEFAEINNIKLNKNYEDSELSFPSLMIVKQYFNENKTIYEADFLDVSTLIKDLNYKKGLDKY